MRPNRAKTCAKSGLLCALLAINAAHGEEAPPPATPDLAQIRQQLEEQSRKLAEQQRALADEEKKLQAHRQALREAQHQLEALQAKVGGAPSKPAQEKVAQAAPSQPVGQAPEPTGSQTTQVAQLFEQPGVLTPHGKLVLEPSLQYSYSTADRVSIVGYTVIPAITVGVIDVQSVNRQTWIGAMTARYGLTNRLEVEARVPYVYRNDDTVTRPLAQPSNTEDVFNATGNHLGDIELAARYQLNEPTDGPYYVAGLRFKTRTGSDPFEVDYVQGLSSGITAVPKSLPTGSGFYSLQPSLSVIVPSDPAVFFGGVNYVWNKSRDVNKDVAGSFIGHVDPGNGVGFNFGMGLALNEKAAFSLGYEHTYIGKTQIDGADQVGATSTQLASLLLGYSYRLSDKTSLSLTVGAGLTKDTPGTQLTLRIPYTL